MDAFFAAVEQRDQPALRGTPVIVGGPSRRGVVAAASYEARAFGIHSAMPLVDAMRRCPRATVVAPNMARYAAASRAVFEIFGRFTPLVEGLSLDEAFLDVTGSRRLFGDATQIAQQIRAAIREELRLTASAGVAPCKLAAKIASDLEKPDGLVVVGEDVAAFLAPLPIERMWGIGPRAAARLHQAGLRTLADLAACAPETLRSLLGSWGDNVADLARGIDPRPVQVGHAAKSIGAEETFENDRLGSEALEPALLGQAQRVAARLFTKGLFGTIVTLKIKYADFTLRTRRRTLAQPAMDTETLYQTARALLAEMESDRPVRLTGLAISGLTTGPIQKELFADARQGRQERLEAVRAQVGQRFGEGHLTRASLLPYLKE